MDRVRLIDDVKATGTRVTAIYVRVTREESLKLDLSIPNQKNRAIELCGERGWQTVKIYEEPRQVGGDVLPKKRPALAALLADVEAGCVERVLVRHTDRLWRSTEVEELVLRALHQHSVELWDFAGPRELRSAGGRFALKVLGAAAELEKGLTAERIREMKRGKALAGKLGGGPPPFGYTGQSRVKREHLMSGLSEDDAHQQACEQFPIAKTWYVDETEAEVVRLIFELYLGERMGSRRISQELNRRGHRRRGGFLWSPVKVGKVINNPAVAGLCSFDDDAYRKGLPSRLPRFRQTLYPGTHPVLIPVERWREAQRLKNEINTPRTRTKATEAARVYPFSGILRCDRCGSHMMGKSSGVRHPAYYICARRKYYGPTDGCPGQTVHEHWAEKTIWAYLNRILESPAFVKELLDRANARLAQDAPEFQNRLAQVRAEIAVLQQQQRKWMERFESAADDAAAEVVWQRMRELKAREIGLTREATELDSKLVGPAKRQLNERDISSYLRQLREGVGTSPTKRRLFAQLLEQHHDLRVRVLDARRLVVSLRLDRAKLSLASGLADPIGERIVIAPKLPTASTSGLPPGDAGPVSPGSPDPGGPHIKTLCPPAAASSSASFTSGCPRTSAMSGAAAAATNGRRATRSRSRTNGLSAASPFRCSTACFKVWTAITSIRSTSAASGAFAAGTTTPLKPRSRAAMASDSTPRIGFTAPSSDSSPTKTYGLSASCSSWFAADSTPSATGSSNAAPSFFRSAGARFTVTRLCGSSKPEFFSAETTRTLLSFTAPSGSPTTLKYGSPTAMSTSTSTMTASIPTTAPDHTLASIAAAR